MSVRDQAGGSRQMGSGTRRTFTRRSLDVAATPVLCTTATRPGPAANRRPLLDLTVTVRPYPPGYGPPPECSRWEVSPTRIPVFVSTGCSTFPRAPWRSMTNDRSLLRLPLRANSWRKW